MFVQSIDHLLAQETVAACDSHPLVESRLGAIRPGIVFHQLTSHLLANWPPQRPALLRAATARPRSGVQLYPPRAHKSMHTQAYAHNGPRSLSHAIRSIAAR